MDDRVGVISISTFAVVALAAMLAYAAGILPSDGQTYSKIAAEADDGIDSIGGTGYSRDGDSVTLSAAVKAGYAFIGWYDSGDRLVSSENPYTFVSEDDLRLKAVTVRGEASLAMKTDGIACVYSTSLSGMDVLLHAVPVNGHTLVKWFDVYKQADVQFEEGTECIRVDVREQRNYVAISDSTLYAGTAQLEVTPGGSESPTLLWIVSDKDTGDYVTSVKGGDSLSVFVAPGSYAVIQKYSMIGTPADKITFVDVAA